MGEREGQKIIDRLLGVDKNLRDAASFVSGIGLAEGDAYAHEVPSVGNEKPTEGDIERYYKKTHHGLSVEDMVRGQLEFFKVDILENNIQLLRDVFFNFFEESWNEHQRKPMQYSGFLDSQGVYSEKELKKFDEMSGQIPLSKPSPLDDSERKTAISIKVSTREKMRLWDDTRNSGRRRSIDEIINDLLALIPKSVDLTRSNLPLRERQILELLRDGAATTADMKEGLNKRGIELSLKAIQDNVGRLVRRGIVGKKRKGNTTEYFLVNSE